jgi:predicted DNA-binding WGR domain protein
MIAPANHTRTAIYNENGLSFRMTRFYRMEVWPDLFGRALLVRHWGRLGTQGRRRLDPHPDPGAAINALATLLRAKRRRGYQDRHA